MASISRMATRPMPRPLGISAPTPPTPATSSTTTSSTQPTKTATVASQMRTKSPNTGFQRPGWPPMRALATSRLL
ncbi:hypothetical protein D9M70_615110 [compost metagenome]